MTDDGIIFAMLADEIQKDQMREDLMEGNEKLQTEEIYRKYCEENIPAVLDEIYESKRCFYFLKRGYNDNEGRRKIIDRLLKYNVADVHQLEDIEDDINRFVYDEVLKHFISETLFIHGNLKQCFVELFKKHPQWRPIVTDYAYMLQTVEEEDGIDKRQFDKIRKDAIAYIHKHISQNTSDIDYSDYRNIKNIVLILFQQFKEDWISKKKYEDVKSKLSELKYMSLSELKEREIAEPKNILGTWLNEKMSCFIHSASGVGKSWFALSCAVAVAGNGTFAKWKNNKAMKVLYIDGEMSLYDLKENASFLAGTMTCDKELVDNNLVFLSKNAQEVGGNFITMNDGGYKTYLENKIKEDNYGLVIFDNVRTLTLNHIENDSSSWDPINELIVSLKKLTAVIVVHHDRKGSQGATEGFSGNTNAITVFESRISLQQNKDADFLARGFGCCFTVKFQKYRGIRSEDIVNSVFGLHPVEGWECKSDDIELMETFLDHYKSGDCDSQKKICAAMKISEAKGTRLKKKILGSGKVTDDDFKRYLSVAKELKQITE